jgi:hypothetical protein
MYSFFEGALKERRSKGPGTATLDKGAIGSIEQVRCIRRVFKLSDCFDGEPCVCTCIAFGSLKDLSLQCLSILEYSYYTRKLVSTTGLTAA